MKLIISLIIMQATRLPLKIFIVKLRIDEFS